MGVQRVRGFLNDETGGIVDANGNELPVAQAVIRPFARAIAGDAIVTSFDPASRSLRFASRLRAARPVASA